VVEEKDGCHTAQQSQVMAQQSSWKKRLFLWEQQIHKHTGTKGL
jgi:hypothetical protein